MSLTQSTTDHFIPTQRSGAESFVPSPVQQYLNKMGKIPVLKGVQETELGRDIQKARKLFLSLIPEACQETLKKHSLPALADCLNKETGVLDLTKLEVKLESKCKYKGKVNKEKLNPLLEALGSEELKTLDSEEVKILKNGVRSHKRFVEANLRLVVGEAKRYQNKGLDLLELISEGNLGLIQAVDNFDPEKGFKFSTYATRGIRQAITTALHNKSRTIRLPRHQSESLVTLKKTVYKLSQTLGREPTTKEIATEMHLTVDEVMKFGELPKNPSSLDAPIRSEEDASSLGDFIADESVQTPNQMLMQELRRENLTNVLRGLSDREQEALTLRYGLKDGNQRTLEQVGSVMNVTRERVRQLEMKAFTKLRHPSRLNSLKGYLESE